MIESHFTRERFYEPSLIEEFSSPKEQEEKLRKLVPVWTGILSQDSPRDKCPLIYLREV